MELLKTIRVKAATWVDTNKIVEGTIQLADRVTLEPAVPQTNFSGYVFIIIDDNKMRHLIAPDTLEIVGLNENSETAKAVYDVTMKMAAAGFTIAETETFWKDCVTSAELMIESKKRIQVNIHEPWDERLLDAFGDLINKDGWLTSDWHEHLEANFKDWDEDGNTTNDKKFLYGLMYNLDFEESEDGKFIRPIKQNKLDQKPKRLFVVDEEINHKKYGLGKVKEVFPTKIVIQFNDREHPLKFLTYLFEDNLIQNESLKCMLFKLEFQERNEYAQAKSLSHLREEYEKEYGDNEPLLEEMITIISEEEAKKIILKNMDESTSEECPEFSLWDIAGGDYFAVLATTEWD